MGESSQIRKIWLPEPSNCATQLYKEERKSMWENCGCMGTIASIQVRASEVPAIYWGLFLVRATFSKTFLRFQMGIYKQYLYLQICVNNEVEKNYQK